MKINTSASELKGAISTVMLAVSSRPYSVAAECILVETLQGELGVENAIRLTATSDLLTLSTVVDARVEEGGSELIRGKMLSDIVKRMPDCRISLESEANRVSMISASEGQIHAKLSGMDPELFPHAEQISMDKTVRIPRTELLNMIEAVERSISQDDLRQALTGACLQADESKITMVGTDGFRMSVYSIANCNSDAQQMEAIIPAKALGVLKKLLSKANDEYVDLEFGRRTLSMQSGAVKLQCKLIDVPYLNWKQIVPRTAQTEVVMGADTLRGAIDRSLVFTKGSDNSTVVFTISDSHLAIRAQSSDGEYSEDLVVETKGEALTIAFNATYIMDMLAVIGNGELHLEFGGPVNPCVARPNGEQDRLCLLLPVRTTH